MNYAITPRNAFLFKEETLETKGLKNHISDELFPQTTHKHTFRFGWTLYLYLSSLHTCYFLFFSYISNGVSSVQRQQEQQYAVSICIEQI